MTRTADVVIVGGSLAGSACAIALGRCGIDVEVFDRDRFPRERVCGAFLSPGAVACLGELDLAGAARAAGASVVDRVDLSCRGWRVGVALDPPGLGLSRRALDLLLARSAGVLERRAVERITPNAGRGFDVDVRTPEGPQRLGARVVVDAAGRSSRFNLPVRTGRFGVRFGVQYGVQHSEDRDPGSVLDFGFYEWGYGGTVAVENGRANTCFLVSKAGVARFRERPGCRVTGPVAFGRKSGPCLAIGDAAGMIDPFSGEGIHHALDSGMLAARAIADGLDHGWSYPTIRARYEEAREWRWGGRRRAGRIFRYLAERPLLNMLPAVPGAPALCLEAAWALR